MSRVYCTICTEVLAADIVASPCGHLYHDTCLTRWLQQKEVCPTCRALCKKRNIIRIYFSDTTPSETSLIQDNPDDLKLKLKEQAELSSKLSEENKKMKKENELQTKKMRELNKKQDKVETRLKQELDIKEALKLQIESLKDRKWTMDKLKADLDNAKSMLDKCTRLKKTIEESCEEAETMIKAIGVSERAQIELATQLIIMKKENEKMRQSKKVVNAGKLKVDHECLMLKQTLQRHEATITQKDEIIRNLDVEIKGLRNRIEAFQKSFNSPNSPRSGIISRLLHESPMPLDIKDMLKENDPTESLLNENVVITSAQDTLLPPPPVFPGQFRFGGKKRPLKPSDMKPIDNSGRKITVFDGLGGRTTILKSPPPFTRKPQISNKKRPKVARPKTISRFIKKVENPPLPTMDF